PCRKEDIALISPIAPLCRREIISLFGREYRKQNPLTKHNFFSLASCIAASTWCKPGISTATGFSQKTCLPSFTANAKWAGLKFGGEHNKTTSTFDLISFSYASKPRKDVLSVTSIRSPYFCFKADSVLFRLSSKISANAVTCTSGSAANA